MRVIIVILIILVILSIFIYLDYIYNKEKRLMTNFLKTYLKKEYHPKNFEVKHRLTVNGKQTGIDNLYGAMWSVDNIDFWFGFYYNTKNKNIKRFSLQVMNIGGNEMTEESVNSLAETYFTNIRKNWVCRNVTTRTRLCESFWLDENNNKIGVGVVGHPLHAFLFLCVHPQGSEIYDWESCASI